MRKIFLKKKHHSHPFCSHSPRGIFLFREDAEDELAFLVGLVGGGNDDILPRAQAETLGHLAQVNVGPGTSLRGARHEEILRHGLLVSVHLTDRETQKQKKESDQSLSYLYFIYKTVVDASKSAKELGAVKREHCMNSTISSSLESKHLWSSHFPTSFGTYGHMERVLNALSTG